MKNYKLGIIGCGNMSQAIIHSLTSEYNTIVPQLIVSDLNMDTLNSIKSKRVTVTLDNRELVNSSNFVLLAVKPQAAASVLNSIDFSNKVIISIMAGVSIDKIIEMVNDTTDKIIRVMPNLNARIGASYNAYSISNITDTEEKFVSSILNSFGTANRVKEPQLNKVTGISGSGPAFVFKFIQAFIESGVEQGFDFTTARQMALETISASVALVDGENDTSIQNLIESVCSKGGTTIQGINFLESHNFNDIVKGAINKSILRAGELEKSL